MTSNSQNICVYCGSSSGTSPAYTGSAVALGEHLVAQGMGLVYGGASIGIMGAIADHVLDRGGRVIGVIPKSLFDLEVAHHGLTELIVTEDMHQRKAKMADLSGGFIAMPGGIGTLEELFEILTWAQLGLHDKPVGVLNVNGFYDQLLGFVDWQVDQGFVSAAHRALLLSAATPAELLQLFADFKPAYVSKV